MDIHEYDVVNGPNEYLQERQLNRYEFINKINANKLERMSSGNSNNNSNFNEKMKNSSLLFNIFNKTIENNYFANNHSTSSYPKDVKKVLYYLRNPDNFELPKGSISDNSIALQSIVLNGKQAKDLIRLCEFSFLNEWKLLYRASRDGFKSHDFHSRCDNIKNTLSIIKSKNGNIFGGFVSQVWDTSDKYKPDSNAFIYTLINEYQTPLKLKVVEQCSAIFAGPTYLVSYGDDIEIAQSADINNSTAIIRNQYTTPLITNGSEISNNLLAGSPKFIVSELEVYALLN